MTGVDIRPAQPRDKCRKVSIIMILAQRLRRMACRQASRGNEIRTHRARIGSRQQAASNPPQALLDPNSKRAPGWRDPSFLSSTACVVSLPISYHLVASYRRLRSYTSRLPCDSCDHLIFTKVSPSRRTGKETTKTKTTTQETTFQSLPRLFDVAPQVVGLWQVVRTTCGRKQRRYLVYAFGQLSVLIFGKSHTQVVGPARGYGAEPSQTEKAVVTRTKTAPRAYKSTPPHHEHDACQHRTRADFTATHISLISCSGTTMMLIICKTVWDCSRLSVRSGRTFSPSGGKETGRLR